MALMTTSEPPGTAAASIRPRWRRWVLGILFLAGLLYAGKLAHMSLREETYWFLLTPPSVGDWEPRGLPREDVWFESADGIKLFGWFIEHPSPRGIVLFLHGSGGNIALPYQIEALRQLHALGLSTFVFDYRGFGRSNGALAGEAGFFADARAAHDWLARRTGKRPEEIIILGRSLGGMLAMHLAGERGARAVIVENAGPSLVEAAAAQYRWAPIRLMQRYRFEVLDEFADYEGPFFQSHGQFDDLIPLPMAAKVYAAAKGPREFFLAAGRDHYMEQPKEYYEALARFLERID